ncbi:hypothetical protein BDV10DRAFT_139391 [Aspergillus recurvatus]
MNRICMGPGPGICFFFLPSGESTLARDGHSVTDSGHFCKAANIPELFLSEKACFLVLPTCTTPAHRVSIPDVSLRKSTASPPHASFFFIPDAHVHTRTH